MIETDVLVIGGGPAGSSAAKHAALGGAKVILVDKRSEIGAPKRCAEGVSKKGLPKLGIEPSPRWITKEIDGVRLTSPDGTDVWLTEEEIELPEAGYILERKVFDKHMAMDAARAGAEIRIKTLATGMDKIEDGFIVSTESMGKTEEIKAKIVIAADGPEGHVARWAGLKGSAKAKEMESGVQYEMVNVDKTVEMRKLANVATKRAAVQFLDITLKYERIAAANTNLRISMFCLACEYWEEIHGRDYRSTI